MKYVDSSGVFTTLWWSIYDKGFFCKNNYLFLVVHYFCKKVPIIDVSQGPKYISETNHLKAFLYIAAVVNLQALE